MGFSSNEWKMSNEETFYQTNFYGGSDDDVADTMKYTDDIDLTEKKMVKLSFRIKPTCATDDLILSLFTRHNENWTGFETRWKTALTVENAGDEQIYSYIIPEAYGPGHYRWGMQSGATTIFDIELRGTKGRTWTVRRSS